jgi:CheY-like chemotaxis protein
MNREDIKILLVEDSPEDIAFTRRVLNHSKLGKHLSIASDGREAAQALDEMAKAEELPDLILLDINLPEIGGMELLTLIKGDPRFASIPVVMLTGSNTNADIQRSYDLGASTYLVKPISTDSLAPVIENLFSE